MSRYILLLLDIFKKEATDMFRDRAFRGERFFHGFKKDSPFSKGDLKYVILGLLKEKPRYGYDVIRSLEEKSHGFYTPSPGVVYPTLQMLEEMGYATSEERDGKKIYSITENGLKFLKENKDFTDEIKGQMWDHWNPENFAAIGQIMAELASFKTSFRSRMRHVSPDKMKRISEVIAGARDEIESILEEKTEEKG
jgi:DNA-binding PadR family transcriptional regulator